MSRKNRLLMDSGCTVDRAQSLRIVRRLDEALVALREVGRELEEIYGDDCGLRLACGGDAPSYVRRLLRRLSDRLPVGLGGASVDGS